MPLLPLTCTWSVPPAPGTTLFVVFAYHGRDGDAASNVWTRLERPQHRGHRITHRDHYANPRTLDYQMALIDVARSMLSPASLPDVVVDSRLDWRVEYEREFRQVQRADVVTSDSWRSGLLSTARSYKHVVLVYADALGLGCDRSELHALTGRASVIVINGRRRAFHLTTGLRHRMRVSRFLAHTRLVERGLAIAVRPLAGVLAFMDRASGR